MRTGWIIGVMMFYLVILGLELMATGGTIFSNAVTNAAGTLLQPEIASSSNIVTQAWSVLANIGAYASAIVSVVLLWSPTVFAGYMIWFYWFICFPVACAMIYGVVTLIRGGGSG
jgi:hypothetical protein